MSPIGTESAAAARPPVTSFSQRRIVGAGIVGNVLEWYDFALYGYLATVFADQFFPAADPALQEGASAPDCSRRCRSSARRRVN